MTNEEEAIAAAEARITEANDRGNYEERYKHLVQAHREQARRSVEIERERDEARTLADLTRAELDEQLQDHMARETGMQSALVGLQRQLNELTEMFAIVVQKIGGHLEITDKDMVAAPKLMITSWREEQRHVSVYRVDEAMTDVFEEDDYEQD